MTRGMVSTMKEVKKLEFSYCHCEEGAERETRQSIVSRRTRAGLSLRFLAHSGSPRAFSPRDDKGGVGAKCLSLRGGQYGRRGNPSCLRESGWGWRFVY